MKLTGAAITNNYENSIQKREIKNNTQQRKETSSSDIATSTPITSVSRLESMGMANLEKSKYYQTQVSLMQKSEKAVDNLFDKLYELEDTNNNTVVNEMQKNMEKAQEEVARLEVDGESGAGMVKVTMTGKHDIKKVTIDEAVMDDKEMLED